MAAGTTQPTNEELIEHLKAAGEGTPEAAAIMGKLWERNAGLVRLTVHRVTGLNRGELEFEDMAQQAFFGFRAAAFSYDPEAGGTFANYAVKRIEWELYRYYDRNGFTVHIPAFMRRRLRECEKTRRHLEAEAGHAVTREAALKAMGLSPAAIASTLAASRKLTTASLDAPRGDNTNGDGAALLDMMADGSNMEDIVIGQEWQRELHAILIEALQDVQEDVQGIIFRHYFSGIPIERMAREYGITRQAVYDREQKAFQSIRAGKYGPELAEFMSTTSSYKQARARITQDKKAIEQLRLADNEMELLAL